MIPLPLLSNGVNNEDKDKLPVPPVTLFMFPLIFIVCLSKNFEHDAFDG